MVDDSEVSPAEEIVILVVGGIDGLAPDSFPAAGGNKKIFDYLILSTWFCLSEH